MSKFEVFSIVAYWIGAGIWVIAVIHLNKSRKKLDEATEIMMRRMLIEDRRQQDDTQV